jgi:23S rRNA pseudouridine2457 synthase
MQHHRYFVVHKPFGVLSQFTKEIPEHQTLADLYDFPPDVYPVGRLDKDSEGLLILTNDKSLTDRLLNPKYQHLRTYWVQVEGQINEGACQQLASGVTIQINKKEYQTLPAQAKPLTKVKFPDRTPPIRFRANILTSWLEIKLIEGKNRQVRKMCAKVGFPVLRLVRVAIVGLELDDLPIGDVKNLTKQEIYDKLG